MNTQEELKPVRQDETHPAENDSGAYVPQKMSFAANVILTIKVLAGFGLLGALLYGVNTWTGR